MVWARYTSLGYLDLVGLCNGRAYVVPFRGPHAMHIRENKPSGSM